MKWEIKGILYGFGIFFIILLSILTAGFLTLPLPAPLPLGFLILTVILLLDLGIEIMRGKSPQVISPVGQWSINAGKDILQIPWHSDILKKNDNKNTEPENLTIMFPGGIDFCGINPKSGPEGPVFIFPSRYLGKEEKNYHVYANIRRKELAKLDPDIRNFLRYYQHRIKKNTPIYCGYTSHLDGSSTPENLKIEFEKDEENKYITELEARLESVYRELRKADEHKTKRLVVGKEVKPIEETT